MTLKQFQKVWLPCGVMLLFIGFSYNAYPQTIKRQCISSYGSSAMVDNLSFMQTAGQSYHTNDVTTEERTPVLQGFQQPVNYSVEEINSHSLKNLNLSVYPNPARNSIRIESDVEIEHSFIRVVSMKGESILSENVNHLLVYNINCETWIPGVYLITICDSQQNSKTLRLIISK